MNSETQIINLEEINANALPELQGWKEKQEALVKENPFIEITDNTTYTEAKKRRTALVKGRTTITNQDKLIASKLKDFRSKVSDASKELIAITLPHEEKQQEEVKRYEAKKEQERIEKQRKEEERKQNIKNKIDEIFESWKSAINNFNFNQIEEINIVEALSEIDTEQFEEYIVSFNEMTRRLVEFFESKKASLQIQEEQRIEAERLAEERKRIEAEQKAEQERLAEERKKLAKEQRIAREKAEAEAEEKRKEQERIDAENQRKADELAKKEAEIQAEKDRLAKLEADRLAKEEKERKAKEETERKKREEEEKKKAEEIRLKRIEELKPDKEKIQKAIDSIQITEEATKIKNKDLKDFYQKTVSEVEAMKETLTKALQKLN